MSPSVSNRETQDNPKLVRSTGHTVSESSVGPQRSAPLIEIIANLKDRIEEAKINGWLGEVEGLKVSLDAAARKVVSLDRMPDRQPGPVNLGVPIIAKSPR